MYASTYRVLDSFYLSCLLYRRGIYLYSMERTRSQMVALRARLVEYLHRSLYGSRFRTWQVPWIVNRATLSIFANEAD